MQRFLRNGKLADDAHFTMGDKRGLKWALSHFPFSYTRRYKNYTLKNINEPNIISA